MYLRTLIGPRAGEILDFCPEAAVAMLNDGRAEMAYDDVPLPAGVTLPKKIAETSEADLTAGAAGRTEDSAPTETIAGGAQISVAADPVERRRRRR